MSLITKGPWATDEIEEFLNCGRYPVRLASTAQDGYPRVVSLWYRYAEGRILCVTHNRSHIARLLNNDHKMGFEIAPNEPPYHGVRGQGDAIVEPLGSKETLEELLGRYLGGVNSSLATWLLSRCDEEVLITITPTRLYTWDYRERMADAV